MKPNALITRRIPKNTYDAVEAIRLLHLQDEEAAKIVYRLSMETIERRFEIGRNFHYYLLHNQPTNGETHHQAAYGQKHAETVAQKVGMSVRTLRDSYAVFKRARTREVFLDQLAKWSNQNIDVTWSMVRNWGRKRLPEDKEKAEEDLQDKIRRLEQRATRLDNDLVEIVEQSKEMPEEQAREVLGTAVFIGEMIEETSDRIRMTRDGLAVGGLPKPIRETDDRYLTFVRARPCSNCGADAPSEPHHIDRGGMGSKGSDLFTIPICRTCHDQIHQVGERTFWQDYNVWQIVAQTQRDYIRSL